MRRALPCETFCFAAFVAGTPHVIRVNGQKTNKYKILKNAVFGPDVALKDYMNAREQNQSEQFNAAPVGLSQNAGLLTNLELAMTNSTFGYEYALRALQEEGEFGMRAEQLRAEVEKHRDAYFEVRGQMLEMDAARLESFEAALRWEKSLLFGSTQMVH